MAQGHFKFEMAASFVLWFGAVSYSIYGVIRARKVFENFYDVYGDFERGWLVKNVKKDSADYEWETILKILFQMYPWLVIHITFSECLRHTYCKALSYWQSTIGILFITYSTGITGAVIILVQPIIFECFHKLRSKFFIWLCAGLCLCFLRLLSVNTAQVEVMRLNTTQHYMIVAVACWINLRCISYYLDHAYSTEHSMIRVLSYCNYLPTLLLGPFISFSNFEKSQKYYSVTLLSVKIKKLLRSLFRFGFWFIFTEFTLHYLYVNALSYHPKMVKSLDNWSLYGFGYCMGQFFHLKYVVLYGLSTSLSQFEHIETPSIPKCIGRIHLYSDMWKYFDEGLYKFLTRYIYLPTLHSKAIKHKIFSSFLCFSFVYIWHGTYQHIFLWAVLNFLGIIIENLFKSLHYKIWSKYHFHWKWKQIYLSLITSPLLAMSAVSNFYFFAGMEIGNIFVERFLQSSILANLSLLFFLSCCCYSSMEIKRWEKFSNNYITLFVNPLKR